MNNLKTKGSLQNNKNFKNVQIYKGNINIENILKEQHTLHLDETRKERLNLALDLNKDKLGKPANIDKIFVVDKGHQDGEELHCVSKKGIIFILNKRKYENKKKSLITVLIARPNQLQRLYDCCNLDLNKEILNNTYTYIQKGYNYC